MDEGELVDIMLETQLAYLAGLIDGEGTIGLYIKNHRKDFSLRVAVYNTDETLMDWLLLNVGGAKHKVGRRSNPKHSQEYCWYVSSSIACNLLIKVLPYLVIKQAKARIAIEAWQNRQPTPKDKLQYGVPDGVFAMREHYVNQFKEVTNVQKN